MNIYICSIVTFAYYYKTIQTFYTSTGILFSYISVLSFVFSLYSDYFLAGSGGLLTGVLEYSGVNDTEATRSYRAQADNESDGKTTDYKPKQQYVLFRCCSFSRLGTVNHDAMLGEGRLCLCNGNYQFRQRQSIRTIIMISTSLIPIIFPAFVFPYTSQLQQPNTCRFQRHVATRRHISYTLSFCNNRSFHKRHRSTNFGTHTRCSSTGLAQDSMPNAHINETNVIIQLRSTAILEQDDKTKTASATPLFQSHTESSFATHVLIAADDAPISVVDVVEKCLSSINRTEDKTELSAMDLIRLGSVWFLPSSDVAKHGTYNPSSGVKPIRLTTPFLTIDNTTDGEGVTNLMMLSAGDYLRIHHNPRRFRMVHDYDWSKSIDEENVSNRDSVEEIHMTALTNNRAIEKEGVIVAADVSKGWLVLNKPAGIPVHMTVDNALENVASCLEISMRSQRAQAVQLNNSSNFEDADIYVATPQRLDQNTSGLLVVATKKMFAAYFAQLLRYKTAELLIHHDNETTNSSTSNIGGINKLYRCLVCLMSPNTNVSWSVAEAELQLLSYVKEQKVMRHYLEPSIRAPKRFVLERPPPNDDSAASSSGNEWPEALLKIRKASRVYGVSGNETARNLARSLFTSLTSDCATNGDGSSIPDNCEGVMELEIELLTGRTHQIRGQLAACNFPLVGDIQYGGAKQPSFQKQNLVTERLALQCCTLEFIDPDIGATKPRRDGSFDYKMNRSERWNSFCISTAWWTRHLNQYERNISCEIQDDEEYDNLVNNQLVNPTEKEKGIVSTQRVKDTTGSNTVKLPNPNLLPPRVSLSRGVNKYVLLRAVHPATPTQEEWFVKSATKTECGGVYHGTFQNSSNREIRCVISNDFVFSKTVLIW